MQAYCKRIKSGFGASGSVGRGDEPAATRPRTLPPPTAISADTVAAGPTTVTGHDAGQACRTNGRPVSLRAGRGTRQPPPASASASCSAIPSPPIGALHCNGAWFPAPSQPPGERRRPYAGLHSGPFCRGPGVFALTVFPLAAIPCQPTTAPVIGPSSRGGAHWWPERRRFHTRQRRRHRTCRRRQRSRGPR